MTDIEFDQVYPERIRKLSNVHWTPIDVAKIALDWLQIRVDSRVLDIGSGVGKFCVIGGIMTEGKFTGVEKRTDLLKISKKCVKDYDISKVRFVNSNITKIDFKNFDAFYYYNPFCEQIAIYDLIDDQIEFSPDKYRMYEDYVIDELDKSPIGTRIVTYCSEKFTLPKSYALRNLMFNSSLALWVKVKE